MKKGPLWVKKTFLFGLNIGILIFLGLVGTVIFYGPRSLFGQDYLIIPEDSLVYEGKLVQLNLTKIADQLKLEGQGKSTVYLAKSDTEVLSNATVGLEVPTLNYKTNMSETSAGVYSVSLPENLIITPQVEGVSTSEIADWKIKPLEYSISVNDKAKTTALQIPPIKVSSLESGLGISLKTSILDTRVVNYISTAGISNLVTTPKTYELLVKTTFKAKVLDVDGYPISNKNLSCALELSNHSYSEVVSTTTNSDGAFSYSRVEKVLITVSGGEIVGLGSPLKIEGASFPVMILQWGGNGGGGGRNPKDDEVDPTKDPENNGKPKTPEDEEGDDPINLTTGNMYHTHQDLFIPGKGIPLNFIRTYNSRDTYEGPLGYGWTHSYNIFLKEDSSGNVRERDEDGSLIIFTKNPDGSYSSPAGNHDTLSKNPDGTYKLRRKNGIIYNFNATGKLTSIVDPNGNETTLTYTGSDLITITDASGREITLKYDANHRVVSLTDPLGRQHTYAYDSQNNLISYTDPLGNTTKYSYDEEDYDDDHNLTKITDARDNNTYITYDDKHRATSFSNEGNNNKITLSYEPDNKKTTVTDSEGNKTIYHYTIIDDIRLVTKIIDPKGYTQEFQWDSELNKISYTDQNGRTTHMSYDSQGNLTSSTDPLGYTTSFTYESTYNKVTSITDPLGHKTIYEYDSKGNLIKITDAKSNKTEYAYDASGNMTSTTNANGNTTEYEYDIHGNLFIVIDALGNETNFDYDLIGNRTQIINSKGNVTSFAYDELNRLLEISHPDGTKVTYTYDEVGNRTSITDPNSNKTTYEYDVVNRLYKVVDPLGGQTNYGYDTEGNRVGITDGNRNTTRYAYDELNRLVEVITPLINRGQYSYDPAGNRVGVIDANGNTVNYAYDANNRLVRVTYPDGSTVNFEYDATDNRTSMTDSQGKTTYTYDELGRSIKVDGPAANDTITYAYDNIGNRISMTDQDGGITTYEYDPLNRLISLTNPDGETTTYSYDEVSNLSQVDYPNETHTEYTYDSLNRLVSLANKRTRLPDVSGANVISSYAYQYDPAGMRTRVILKNNNYIQYTYDALNRLTSETKKCGFSGRTIYSYTYAFDRAGNRTSMTKKLYQMLAVAQLKEKGYLPPDTQEFVGVTTYDYTYDRENRLLEVEVSGDKRKIIPLPKSWKMEAPKCKSNEILVKFKPGVSEEIIERINTKFGTQLIKQISKLGTQALSLPAGFTVKEIVEKYREEPEVLYVEPNYLMHTLLTPNDPNFSQQWGLNNTGQTGGIPDSDIDAPEAWDVETGDPSLVIAIVDTGVDFDHPDLAGKIIPGYDFVNDDDEAQDDHGHGTFVAGIAAAASDNNTAGAGVCWYNQIMPVKVMDSTGTGTHADVADGIVYAADNGADIINLSIGDSVSSTTLEEAIKYAYNMGVGIVAGAGNNNGPVLYPAAYDNYVIAVAATDHNDKRASWSNYGPEIDVAAPGVNIYSTSWNDTYATKSGTSASTPFVSGVAALLLSEYPSLTPDEVQKRIKSTCDDVNSVNYPGEDDYLGAGRLNAYSCLTAPDLEEPEEKKNILSITSYEYDKDGNQVKKTIRRNIPCHKQKEFVTTYKYDYENRLIKITYPQLQKGRFAKEITSEYLYDGGGKRIRAIENGKITKYLYDGRNVIIERNWKDNTVAYYTRGLDYGGGIGGIISAKRDIITGGSLGSYSFGNRAFARTIYYHYDGIGSVTDLTGPYGMHYASYSYDAYGNILRVIGLDFNNPYNFSTKEYNPKSGLVYFGARYYDPEIGRFITKDPLEMVVKAENLYVYCYNNPINYLDHWGNKPGDKYATQDEAAKDAMNDIYGPSVNEDREYGGWIYKNKDGTYSYTKPKRGKQHELTLPPKPKNSTAYYHSHGAESGPLYDDENFSPRDRTVANNNGVDAYLVTPSGQMKRYDQSANKESDIGKVGGKK